MRMMICDEGKIPVLCCDVVVLLLLVEVAYPVKYVEQEKGGLVHM